MTRWRAVLITLVLPLLVASPAMSQKEKGHRPAGPDTEVMLPAERVTGFQPGSATDYDLQNIVYAAYRAARNSALGNENYFVHGDVSADDLRLMMLRDLVQTGYMGLTIAYDEADDFSHARECTNPGTTELRLHYSEDGIGMSLVAVNDKRFTAYDYDPSVSSRLQITSPEDCQPATEAEAAGSQ